MKTMTKGEALLLAVSYWGPLALVSEIDKGEDKAPASPRCFVGALTRAGDINSRVTYGRGDTWEEAFADARNNGHITARGN